MLGSLALTTILVITMPKMIDKIVADVEGTPITLYEVQHYSKIYNTSLTQTLNSLIENIIVEKEAKKLNIEISDEELNTTILNIMKQEGLTQEEFNHEISKMGFRNFNEYKHELKLQMLKTRLGMYLYRSRHRPSDEELRKYYLSHKEQECVSNPQVEIYHIFIKGKDEDAINKISSIYKKLKNIKNEKEREEKFEEFARRFSQAPSAGEGGKIGWIERGTLIPEIEKIAFSQPVGAISPPLAVKNGFHIIYTRARKEKEILNFETCKKMIEKIYIEKKMEEWYKKWVKKLREQKEIEMKGM